MGPAAAEKGEVGNGLSKQVLPSATPVLRGPELELLLFGKQDPSCASQ